MTTEETRRSVSYSNIVNNLLTLRDEVRETSHEEAVAIERIVSDVMALQLQDAYVNQRSMACTPTDSAPAAGTCSLDGGVR